LVTSGPGEERLAETVVDLSGGAAERAPGTRSLGELLALLERSAVVVGADSGPVVLAATLGVPTVALFGPKDPAIYAPLGPRVEVVWKGVYCSPCSLRQCGDPICMSTLSPEAVAQAVERVLSPAVQVPMDADR
jgi:ADP-heptose:LPS heptosyltransferase